MGRKYMGFFMPSNHLIDFGGKNATPTQLSTGKEKLTSRFRPSQDFLSHLMANITCLLYLRELRPYCLNFRDLFSVICIVLVNHYDYVKITETGDHAKSGRYGPGADG